MLSGPESPGARLRLDDGRLLPGLYAALWLCILGGTLANGAVPILTPISLLDLGPASWAYELILLVIVLLLALCWTRWARFRRQERLLGVTLGLATLLFLLLVEIPFQSSPLHEPVAMLAMAALGLHATAAASKFEHPALVPSAILAVLSLLLVGMATPRLIGAGEHLLLVASTPAILLCYGSSGASLPDARSTFPYRCPALMAALWDRRSILSGCAWTTIVVTTMGVCGGVEAGAKGMLPMAALCYAGGAFAGRCRWRFPDACACRILGAAAGVLASRSTGGDSSFLRLIVLCPFGLGLTILLHWVLQGVADVREGMAPPPWRKCR